MNRERSPIHAVNVVEQRRTVAVWLLWRGVGQRPLRYCRTGEPILQHSDTGARGKGMTRARRRMRRRPAALCLWEQEGGLVRAKLNLVLTLVIGTDQILDNI